MPSKNFTPLKNFGTTTQQNLTSGYPSHLREIEPPRHVLKETSIFSEQPEKNLKEIPTQQVVQAVDNKIKLDQELIKAGVKASDDVGIPAYLNIHLPISDEKVVQGRRAPIYSSLRWLSMLATYVLWQAHITLKVVHGKVVRILRR